MDSATKRPWQWHKIADAPVYGIYGNTTLKYVASVLHEEEAKLIVKAVNLHDELVDTLLHLKHNRHHTIEEEIWKIDEILKKVQNA